jgi:predicted RNA binding protein YcfA (HicA-like mRNA interferase family)
MRLQTLERELAALGFTLARICGSHRIYRDARGHVLTLGAHDRHRVFSRAELCAIRRDVRRLLSVDACSPPHR